jgi:hypothetical protein
VIGCGTTIDSPGSGAFLIIGGFIFSTARLLIEMGGLTVAVDMGLLGLGIVD